jgi:hypothetical protein
MGKASSSKKVARAAGLGGSRNFAARPAWTYYFAVSMLLLLGVIGVYNSREYLDGKVAHGGSGKPSVNMTTPWFEGYAVDECGTLLPPVKTAKNPNGITTKGDGIIYINPKNKSSAGKNATLAKFASAAGITLNAGELQVPGSRLYTNDDTCDGKQGHVYVMVWTDPSAPASDGVLQNTKQTNVTAADVSAGNEDTCNPDCDSGVRLENDQLITIAFLPAPAKGKTLSVLQPSAAVVAQLTKLVGTPSTTTTAVAPATPSSTGAVPSTTTPGGASSSSTSPSSTTPSQKTTTPSQKTTTPSQKTTTSSKTPGPTSTGTTTTVAGTATTGTTPATTGTTTVTTGTTTATTKAEAPSTTATTTK